MPKFYCIPGGLGDTKLLEQHAESIASLVNGSYARHDLEMLKGHHGVYSLRLNKGERLIFTTVKVEGSSRLLLLDYLPTHDYHRCRYLNPQVLKQYIAKQEAAAAAEGGGELVFEPVDERAKLFNVRKPLERDSGALEAKPLYYYKEQLVVLNPAQEESLALELPAVVSGVAGSGKSCVALAALAKAASHRENERPIWYVTGSPLLVDEMRAQWPTQAESSLRPVVFMTYAEFLRRQMGGATGELVGERCFEDWYTGHLKKEKKKAGKSASKAVNYPDANRAHQEFRLCSGYSREEYLALGRRQSRLEEAVDREFLYEAFEAYKEHLGLELIDPAFCKIPEGADAECSLLVVDEAQDFSTGALKAFCDVARGQVLYCMDSHQRVEDDLSVLPFLTVKLRIPAERCVQLSATYRCPLKVISAANQVIRLKHILTGGKIDKDELPCVSGMGGDEKVMGSLHYLEEEAFFENPLIKNLAQTTRFAVITTPERAEEIKKRLGTPLVFTPNAIKGLEYDEIATVGLYDEELFKSAAERLATVSEPDKAPVNRSKKGQEDVGFITPFNEIYVAYTRARRRLFVVEKKTRDTKILLERLDPLFDKELPQDLSFDNAVSANDWLEQVKLQIKAGNEALASEIYSAKISGELGSFEAWKADYLSKQVDSRASQPNQKPLSKNLPNEGEKTPPPGGWKAGSDASSAPVANESQQSAPPSGKAAPEKTPASKPVPVGFEKLSVKGAAIELCKNFSSEGLTEALRRHDAEGLLFGKHIKQRSGKLNSLMDYVKQKNENNYTKVFCSCLVNNWSLFRVVAPLLINKLDKKQSPPEWLSDFKELSVMSEKALKIPAIASSDLPEHMTLTHTAVYARDIKALELLKAYGADIDRPDGQHGYSPFFLAAHYGYVDELITLKEMGADVNQAESTGRTPCFTAAFTGRVEVLKLLGQLGADVNKANNDGATPLYVAAQKGHVGALRLLSQLGADVNKANNNGATPFYVAAANGHVGALEALKGFGADVNKASNNGATPFYVAAENGRVGALKALKDFGVDVNQAISAGWTPCHVAAQNGHVETLKLLSQLGADVKKASNTGWTPCHIAAQNGHVETLKLLSELGADVKKADDTGITPLYTAAQNGHVSALEALKGFGADVNQAGNAGWTPCHIAAANGHAEALRALKDLGAEVHKVNKHGWTPFCSAAARGRVDVLRVLEAMGANVNHVDVDGWTACYIAARNGRADALRHLVGLGLDVNKAGNDGSTPFYAAAQKGHVGALEALKGFGADVNQANNTGCTPCFIAAQNGHIDALKLLNQLGADVHKANNNGETPFFAAAQNGDVGALEALKGFGANVNHADRYGWTPCFIAAFKGRVEALKLLDQWGANVNQATNDGAIPFYAAAKNGHVDALKLLNQLGADVNRANNDGCTPCFIAAKNGHVDALKLLNQLGADVNRANNDGCTPFFIAAFNGHVDALKLLNQLGTDVNQANNDSATPSFIAAQNGHIECIKELIAYKANLQKSFVSSRASLTALASRHGADIIARMEKAIAEHMGRPGSDEKAIPLRPIDIAIIMGHEDIVTLLSQAMVSSESSGPTLGAGFFDGQNEAAGLAPKYDSQRTPGGGIAGGALTPLTLSY